MSLFEYDEKKHERTMMEIGREEGHAEGLAEGDTCRLLTQIVKKVKKQKSLEQIAEELEEDISEVQPLYETVLQFAPEYDIDAITAQILSVK